MPTFLLGLLLASGPALDGGARDAGQASATSDGGAPRTDAGVTDAFPRAADGTPMVLPNGGSNPAYYNPPKTYRSPEGFQGAHWGMTTAEVKKAFPKARSGKGVLAMTTTIVGLKAQVIFYFARGQLAEVFISLSPGGFEASDLNDALFDVRNAMRDKYGPPQYNEDHWEKDVFKDDYETALALGHVVPEITWQNGETQIVLSTDIGELHRAVTLTYKGRRMADLMEAEVKARSAERSKSNGDGL